MVSKASKAVWTLRRMKSLGVDTATLTQFWRTEGRAHLEYQAQLWHSSIKVAQARDLARAQRVTMAAITGWWHSSYSSQLEELSLQPLYAPRTRLCKQWAPDSYKIQALGHLLLGARRQDFEELSQGAP